MTASDLCEIGGGSRICARKIAHYFGSEPFGFARNEKKSQSMETVLRFFDEVDDLLVSTLMGLRRLLSWTPRERRRVPRTPASEKTGL